MMRQMMAAAQQQGGGAGPAVYVEEDFTLTTTGDLTTNNLAVDELGGGWLGDADDFDYDAGGGGVSVTAGAIRVTWVQTDGREDVQVTGSTVLVRGSGATRWVGWGLRGIGTSASSGLVLKFYGATTGPNLVLIDGAFNGTVIKTWDLSGLTTPPVNGDTVEIVARCSGNDITLVSLQVNGGAVQAIGETHTLTGAAATAHGASSGADYYGLVAGRPGTGSFYEDFKVESIPA